MKIKLLIALSLILFSCDNGPANNSIKNHITGTLFDESGNRLANKSVVLDYRYPALEYRPTTSITFSIDSPANINMWIEDNCNNLVKTLVSNTSFQEGDHTVEWDATDQTGNIVLAGGYYVNIEINDELHTMDMQFVPIYEYYDSIEGMNTFATTDENGFFSIPMECLIFDKTYLMQTELGFVLEEYTIPYEVKLSFFDEESRLFTTEFLDVNPYGENFYILIHDR